jgi:hypothetical protein
MTTQSRRRNRVGNVVNENDVVMCFHGRTGRAHSYEPGESCPPNGPVEPGPCPGCGADHGYPPAGPCLDHGTRKAVAG